MATRSTGAPPNQPADGAASEPTAPVGRERLADRPVAVLGVAPREEQLAALLRAIAEVVDGDFEPDEMLRRLSEAVHLLVPHERVDVGWIEEGLGGYYSLAALNEVPEEDRPGEPLPIVGSGREPVVLDGAPLVIADAASDERVRVADAWGRHPIDQDGYRSWLVVPLRLARRIRGFLEFQHRQPGVYTDEHLANAETVANQIAPVVEVIHLFRTERLVRRQLETVVQISHAISVSLDLDEILPLIGTSLTETLALPTCALYLYDDERRALVPRVACGRRLPPGLDGEAIERAFYRYSFPVDEPFGAAMCALREPLVIDRPAEHEDHFPAGFLRDIPLVAVMEVPFVVRDRLVGLAALPVWERGRGFNERQLKLAMGIAQSAAVSIEHAQLYRQARELGKSEERNRLAREVHDTLAQGLTAIALQLEAAERSLPPGAEAKRLVHEARDLARRSLDEARRAVWGLSPSPLDGRSLADALADEVAAFGRRAGLTASFAQRGDPPPLGQEAATALLRVALEALHNVEKHAEARRVRVELDYRRPPGQLVLLVADDGRGFDPDADRAEDGGGFGLTSMRERMRLVGGELDVETAAGWGTRVRARLQVPEEPASAPADERPAAGPVAPARVLLVDDHPLAREGVRRLLGSRADIVVVGEASDGVEGVERALALRPDIVLMDLQMPRMSGVAAVQALREAWPDARVLILTTFAQDEHLFEALRAGARGYLLKDAGPDELAEAIRTVSAGGSLVQPVMASRLLDRFGQLATRQQLPEALTARELEVLHLVAAGARNKEIADRLVVSEKTVKYHLGQIYAKLEVGGRTEAVAKARSLGLLPDPETAAEPPRLGPSA